MRSYFSKIPTQRLHGWLDFDFKNLAQIQIFSTVVKLYCVFIQALINKIFSLEIVINFQKCSFCVQYKLDYGILDNGWNKTRLWNANAGDQKYVVFFKKYGIFSFFFWFWETLSYVYTLLYILLNHYFASIYSIEKKLDYGMQMRETKNM